MFNWIRKLTNPQPNSYGPMAAIGQGGKKSAPATIAVSSSTPTLLMAANGNRVSVVIKNAHATTVLYVGRDTTVTAANGIPLAAGVGLEDFTSTDNWYGIQASATGDARVYEVSR